MIMSLASTLNCSAPDHGICLSASKPIIQTFTNTTDVGACCRACDANKKCVAWNVNTDMRQCFLRAVYVSNPGSQCISGRTRDPPPPAPPSDQRPQLHHMPRRFFTNDVQGPFYDPVGGKYHMGYAWHVNGTEGIGSAPNRWYHTVSDDLATWKVVSTTPERAMLSPDTSYDDLAVMTGSVTLIGPYGATTAPAAMYSCRGTNKSIGSQTIAVAYPRDVADPLRVAWTKSAANPVIQHPTSKSAGFRDPSTAWLSNGKWRTAIACAGCFDGVDGAVVLYASASRDDFERWSPAGSLMNFTSMIECPDFFPAVDANGARSGRHVLKYNQHGEEFAVVGTYDEAGQTLVDVVAPPQLLDGGPVYAGKSFWDPVNRQQVYLAWVHEQWTLGAAAEEEGAAPWWSHPRQASGGGCVNASVCGTHTLPRAVIFDAQLGALVTPPIPQLAELRGPLAANVTEPIALPGVPAGQQVGSPELSSSRHRRPPASDALRRRPQAPLVRIPGGAWSGRLQLELRATFALPTLTAAAPTATLGLATRAPRNCMSIPSLSRILARAACSVPQTPLRRRRATDRLYASAGAQRFIRSHDRRASPTQTQRDGS